MIVIEMAGAPGSGKTSLTPMVLRTCRAVGIDAYTVQEAARVLAARTVLGRVAARLPSRLRSKALWAVYYAHSLTGAVRLGVARPGLVRHVYHTQRGRPAAADARGRRVVYWYIRTAGSYAFVRRWGRPGEAFVFDEGFVHRTVQLHASSAEEPRSEQFAEYVSLLPRTDVIVAVETPVATCIERVRARGVWPRLLHAPAAEVDRFISNAHRTVSLTVEVARHDGRQVLTVNNDRTLEAAGTDLRERLEALLSETPSPRGGPSPVPGLRVPRVAQLRAGLRAARRGPAIDRVTCQAVLDRYGLAADRTTPLTFGARNANVVVHTTAGPRVLRRYRETATPSTVRHEHAVIGELQRRGVPAVRLVATPDDATVVEHDGSFYALFHYETGVNLSTTHLARSHRSQLFATAGRCLATMHTALCDFRPTPLHHLGERTSDGHHTQGLDWYLEVLGDVAARDPARGDVAAHHALREQRADIASRLEELDRRLTPAALPMTVIHGDYGLHNLLFGGDGPAVITDLELARREWRLVDLVIVLSRISADGARAFLGGYRQEASIPAAEWRHFADVWQYYRLTGAVRSWRNYFLYGGERRLVSALARVREADRCREELVPL